MEAAEEKKVANPNRRTFLVLGATGAIAFIAGKFFGDGFPLKKKKPQESLIAQKDFKNFVLTETENEMSLIDRFGNKLVVIDKDSFSGQ